MAAVCGILLGWSWVSTAAGPAPFADVHLHFNWNQQGTTTPAEALAALKGNNVVLAGVSSSPPDLALELANAADGWMIPFFMPYLEPEGRHTWFNDERVVAATRKALESGEYSPHRHPAGIIVRTRFARGTRVSGNRREDRWERL